MHTNIVSRDCARLAEFYCHVFGCELAGKQYELVGDWLKKGAHVPSGKLAGIDLRLPGFDKDGPILEIFQYDEMLDRTEPVAAHRQGLGHLAFSVDDVVATLETVLAAGGGTLGELATKEFKGGTLTFVYAKDPEGNIIEIQHWEGK
jgi:catechol 2,3-dioxygenase-like lactoylglutathione lyase family enzyme